MIYEMRTYYCAPGRLPALNERFSTITLKFWEKYGIKQVGFWTTLVGSTNQTLTYMLAWESLAERETKWNAFASDPEWLAKRAATEAQAIIVERIENQFLTPTAYSAMQ
ncbi:NIPSNAP family protein [Glaciimonas sp. PCH181]|uniref:NIPSNAP family protein n=1 Tax=Glaciimonas sp. PCH181 TaxID=2133943 RepID=UPI000D349C21|nr:NIPSNAP family protein [Glaciimonas sp. PCH181]PUA20292.1 NIPSNAP family protein [Glaciimonas sp. PCH181]